MPGELGTFLALTGLPITGEDATMHGITDKLVHSSKPFEDIILDTFINMEFPIPNGLHLTDNNKINPWRKQMTIQAESEIMQHQNDHFERNRNRHEYFTSEEFFEPKDKMPGTVGDADF